MSDEHTGPHPVVAATRNEGNLIVNTRTMMMIGALLLGGTVGGGGITLATKSPPLVTAPEVTAALADLNSKAAATNVALGHITVTLAEMKQQLNSTARDNDKRDGIIADHEMRLRRLEGRR